MKGDVEQWVREELFKATAGVSARQLSSTVRRRARNRRALRGLAAGTIIVASLAGAVALQRLVVDRDRATRVAASIPVASIPRDSDVGILVDGNGGRTTSEVLAVNSTSAGPSVVARYESNYAPAAAYAPAANRLFIASIDDSGGAPEDRLQVIDTLGGTVVQEGTLGKSSDIYNRARSALPVAPAVVATPDGARVFVRELSAGSAGERSARVTTYDVATNQLLPDTIALEGCTEGFTSLLPVDAKLLAIVCEEGHKVGFAEVSATGGTNDISWVPLPHSADGTLDDYGNPMNLGSLASAWTLDGAVWTVTHSGQVYQVAPGAEKADVVGALRLPPDTYVTSGSAGINLADREAYLGIRGRHGFLTPVAESVAVIRIDGLSTEAIIDVEHDFAGLASSASGSDVYAPGLDGRVTVIDTGTETARSTLITDDPLYVG
jgi:hypothetical protein